MTEHFQLCSKPSWYEIHFNLSEQKNMQVPVCSAIDLYDSTDHDEHWQQLT